MAKKSVQIEKISRGGDEKIENFQMANLFTSLMIFSAIFTVFCVVWFAFNHDQNIVEKCYEINQMIDGNYVKEIASNKCAVNINGREKIFKAGRKIQYVTVGQKINANVILKAKKYKSFLTRIICGNICEDEVTILTPKG